MTDEAAATFIQLWRDGLAAMNAAMLIAMNDGSPRAVEFIADYLSNTDGGDEEILTQIEQKLNGRAFPPDLAVP